MNMNLYAFLAMLRHGEGTVGANGYRTMFGGGLFNSFDDHPRKKIRRRAGAGYITSTAAGAYQFLARTWDSCRDTLDLPDFSPASQDQAARLLIHQRGALNDVLAGRLEAAVKKCNREWASLPGSPYGQPTVTMARCKQLFADYGGTRLEG
jgi:lysozyme